MFLLYTSLGKPHVEAMEARFLGGLPDDVDPKIKEMRVTEMTAAVEAEYRVKRGDHLKALEWWFRDIWLQSLDADPGLLAFPELAGQTQRRAARVQPGQARQNIAWLEDLQRRLATNAQEALAMEVHFLKFHF